MKNIQLYLLFLLSTIILLTSCTEIIDININTSTPQIVVEATIGTNQQPWVIITKTSNLDGNNNFERVENAQVSISDNDGNSIDLVEVSPGQYVNSTSDFTGTIGKTYQLNIQTEENTISSTSTIPAFVPIDSISVINSIYPGGGPPVGNNRAPFYEIYVHYTDPAITTNYYRIILSINDLTQNENRVYTDNYNNGKAVVQTLIIYNDSLKSGDKIAVEMQCIDKNVYNYFQSMGNSSIGGGSPANPYTNLTGTILGYFSAYTVDKKEYIIP